MAGQHQLAMSVSGIDDGLKKLSALRVSIKPILRQAARKSSTPITKMAKSLLPAKGKKIKYNGKKVFSYGRSGQLRKSMASRVATGRDGVVRSIIGARRKFATEAFKAYHKPKRSVKAQNNVMVRVNPTYYSHLIEQGFTAKIWRSKKMRPVAGRGFLRKSLNANYANVQSITGQVLQARIDKVAGNGQPIREQDG